MVKNNKKQLNLLCSVCGVKFTTTQVTKKFCSKSCKNKYHYEKRAEIWRAYKKAAAE